MIEQHRADKAEIASSQAIIEQKNKDAITSAKQIGLLNGQMQATAEKVQPLVREIYHETVTSTCGPAVQHAADGVRLLLGEGDPGSSYARPVTPGPVHKASGAPVPLVRH
jgi:hypothetical protein